MNPTTEKLAADVAHYLKLARGNYFTVWAMYLVSMAASVLATVFAATGFLSDRRWLAVVTVIPAAVIVVNNGFKFSARSQWHYEKKRRLDSLLRLAVAGATATSEPEVAEKWNQIDEEMDAKWPGWGELPKVPQRPRGDETKT